MERRKCRKLHSHVSKIGSSSEVNLIVKHVNLIFFPFIHIFRFYSEP